MRLRWIYVALLCGGFALNTATMTLRADPKTDRQFESIANLLGKADRERETGNINAARKLYGATMTAYEDFHRKHPDEWVELIQFRIVYCRNQLMNLLTAQHKAELEKQPDTPSGPNEKAKPQPQPTPQNDITKAIAKGINLCRMERYADAEDAMQSLIKEHPKNSNAYLVLGTACMGKGDFDTATTLIQRAITLKPENRQAHYNLCQLLIRADTPDFEAARQHYRQALKLGAAPDTDLEAVLGLE